MKISVVVPVYNVENYLEECIESLLQQTVRFHEIILLNDGSTDESQRICEKYCNRYLEIKLINNKTKRYTNPLDTFIMEFFNLDSDIF